MSAPSGAPRVVLMRRWWLRPWKQARILAGNLDAARLGLESQGRDIERLRAENEQMRRETALASGGSPVARSVGWEQPAGAVVPQLAVLAFGRGSQPGLRVYASRDLAGSVIEAAGQDDDARFRAHLIMGRMIILNAPALGAAMEDIGRIWTAAPPPG